MASNRVLLAGAGRSRIALRLCGQRTPGSRSNHRQGAGFVVRRGGGRDRPDPGWDRRHPAQGGNPGRPLQAQAGLQSSGPVPGRQFPHPGPLGEAGPADGDGGGNPPGQRPGQEPSLEPASFWGGKELPDDLLGEVRFPEINAALPKRFGNFPFWRGKDLFLESLEPFYFKAAPMGMDIYLGLTKPRAGEDNTPAKSQKPVKLSPKVTKTLKGKSGLERRTQGKTPRKKTK